VKDRVNPGTGTAEGFIVPNIPLDQLDAPGQVGQVLPPASGEAVKYPHCGSTLNECLGQVRSNESTSAGHKKGSAGKFIRQHMLSALSI
jgi:hypothetical protein